ncbi:cysteine rich repeat-containing protein [Azospirillum sp. A39]|uniref:cysteine rich repeat-containing protein n=1 Tax=Azospirillum sp. A39 TaxID=3462279 RepID=UPI004045C58D
MKTPAFRRRLSTLGLGAVLLALAAATTFGAATAQTQPSPERRAQAREAMQACRADVRQLCSGVNPGGGRILACLQQNADRITQPCREALQRAETLRSQRQPGGPSDS